MSVLLKSSDSNINQRVRKLRTMLRHPRKYFEEQYNIPEITLKSWENSKNNSLSENAIEKCIEVFANEGLIVNRAWLKTGQGSSPYFMSHNIAVVENHTNKVDDLEVISSEFILKDVHKVLKVYDDYMEPKFQVGSIVIGEYFNNINNLKALNGQACIIKLVEQELLVIRMVSCTFDGHIFLAGLNPKNSDKSLIIFPKVEKAYIIKWVRFLIKEKLYE